MGRRILLLGGLAAVVATAPAGAAPRLERFRSCDGLVSYARKHALKTGGLRSRFAAPRPAPLTGAPGPVAVAPPAPRPGMAQLAPAPAAPAAAAEATADYSGTNVQEAGIDEPDVVKTDGSRIFAIVDGTLFAVDGRASTPRLLGSLKLGPGWSYQLLLRGNRLLVLFNAASPTASAASTVAPPTQTYARIAEVDVTDPGAMRVVRVERVDGSYVSARVTGRTARVVVASSPRAIPVPLAAATAPAQAREQARRRNRASIRRAGLAGWVPAALVNDRRMRRRILRPAVSCRRVMRASSFSGSGMLTVLTIDLDKGLPAVDTDGLMTDAQTVYASERNLYVATQKWAAPTSTPAPVPATTRTLIHQFDASEPAATTYAASGDVPGVLLNQFAMSEYRGHLRVASTDTPPWVAGAPPGQSDNMVSVLERRDRALETIGKAAGMGRGERIFAVRFIDDMAFVVTFRQIDPLYTVDLSNPARPRVVGELEMLGYSAYLHPVGKDRLLGVGQAVRAGSGTQLSLFDTSNPANPRRIAQHVLGAGSSDVEFDHHAFLYWAPQKLAVIPITEWRETRFAGLVGFRVDPTGQITEVGRVSDESNGWFRPISRSLVMGDRLFALSDEALLARRLDTFAPLARVPFGIEHPAPPPWYGGPIAVP